MNTNATNRHQHWNKGKLVGQKAQLRVRAIWAIRVRLQLADSIKIGRDYDRFKDNSWVADEPTAPRTTGVDVCLWQKLIKGYSGVRQL